MDKTGPIRLGQNSFRHPRRTRSGYTPDVMVSPRQGRSGPKRAQQRQCQGYESDDTAGTVPTTSGPWGPVDRVHGEELFVAMGKVYAERRLRQMVEEGVAEGASEGVRADVSKGTVSTIGSERHREGMCLAEWRRERAEPPPPPPPATPAGQTRLGGVSAFDTPVHVAAPVSPSSSSEPPVVALPVPSGAVQVEKPRNVRPTPPPSPVHDSRRESSDSSASIDFSLYDRLRPTERTPRIRGAMNSSLLSPTDGVASYRAQLRETFWQEYMFNYDRICARSGPFRHRPAVRKQATRLRY